VPQIIEEVLTGNGFTSLDYEMKLGARDYPKREYLVQFQETDLSFLSRLCEQEGIFYFFQQEEEAEKIVFADSTDAYEPLGGNDIVSFRPAPRNGGAPNVGLWLEHEAVQELSLRHTPLPKEVVLRDYNYRTPSADLRVSSEVDGEGIGTVFEYGDHYMDLEEGRALAKVRAEELRCRERIFQGTGTVRSFRPGLTYELAEHYREDWNRRYLITEVRHKGMQSMTAGNLTNAVSSYRNDFASIPADRVYRPERLTPKPRIFGTIHAKVDAAGDGEYAEVDDQGRYKVQLPFDLSGRCGGRASGYVRMAQPYAGAGMGMHFPLHKGTEVILTHIDGDPDRPIIASAVANPETAGPVSGGNQSQCAIRTGGGNGLVIEDSAGAQKISLNSPTEGSFFTMGAANSPPGFNLGTAAHMNRELGGDEMLKAGGNQIAKITGDVKSFCGKSNLSVVGGARELMVAASNQETIGGSDQVNVGGKSSMTVAGSRTVSAAKITQVARGNHAVQASANVVSKSGGKTLIKANGTLLCDGGGNVTVTSGAKATVKSKGPTVIDAQGAATLQSADKVHIKGGGTVGIQGPAVIVKGPTDLTGDMRFKGKLTQTGEITVKGATRFKGDHHVTGTSKFNGNTLEVS